MHELEDREDITAMGEDAERAVERRPARSGEVADPLLEGARLGHGRHVGGETEIEGHREPRRRRLRLRRSTPGDDDGLSRRAEHDPLAAPAVDLEPLAGPIHRHRERGGRLGRIDPERLLGARELRLTPPTDVRECLLDIGPGVRVDLESTPAVELIEREALARLRVARAAPGHHRAAPGRLLAQPVALDADDDPLLQLDRSAHEPVLRPEQHLVGGVGAGRRGTERERCAQAGEEDSQRPPIAQRIPSSRWRRKRSSSQTSRP